MNDSNTEDYAKFSENEEEMWLENEVVTEHPIYQIMQTLKIECYKLILEFTKAHSRRHQIGLLQTTLQTWNVEHEHNLPMRVELNNIMVETNKHTREYLNESDYYSQMQSYAKAANEFNQLQSLILSLFVECFSEDQAIELGLMTKEEEEEKPDNVHEISAFEDNLDKEDFHKVFMDAHKNMPTIMEQAHKLTFVIPESQVFRLYEEGVIENINDEYFIETPGGYAKVVGGGNEGTITIRGHCDA